jgi:hypothetical protein
MSDGQSWTFRDTSTTAAQTWKTELQSRIDSARQGTLRSRSIFTDSVTRVYVRHSIRVPGPANGHPASETVPITPGSETVHTATLGTQDNLTTRSVFFEAVHSVCSVCFEEYDPTNIPPTLHYSNHDVCIQCLKCTVRSDIGTGGINVLCPMRCGVQLTYPEIKWLIGKERGFASYFSDEANQGLMTKYSKPQ